MKILSRLFTALIITLLLSMVALPVWATPAGQGTVPNPEDTAPIFDVIPVTGGGYQVDLLCDCQFGGLVTRITEPELERFPAVKPFEYLSAAFKVELEGPCDIELCFPYPVDFENKKGQIFKLGSQEWDLLDSTIYEEEDPRLICSIDRSSIGGTYALISSEKVESVKLPYRVTMCDCSVDDVITTLEDPAKDVGKAPEGFEFLNSATKINCEEACEIEVCFPYSDDEKSKDGQIYQWESNENKWVLAQYEITTDPNRICTLNKNSLGGIYALIGK